MTVAPTSGTAHRPPPWDWSRLTPDQLRHEWEELSSWVEQLQQQYSAWMDLPACWPLHEALRSELAFLWYWHRSLYADPADPSQGIRWHSSLHSSSQAWWRLASCRHEGESAYAGMLGREWNSRLEHFVEQAVEAYAARQQQ